MPINENFILKNIGNEYMIIPLVDGGISFNRVFNVTETGALTFNMLKENRTITEIVKEILALYDVSEEVCLKDTNEFIEQLRMRGIYND